LRHPSTSQRSSSQVSVKAFGYLVRQSSLLKQQPVGSPCQWKNESPPIQVSQPDKGPRIIDQNGFRTSVGGIGYLLPTIAAVNYNQTLKEEPPFDWSSVDIVADRSALRKLGRWANKKLVFSQKVRKSDKLFRLDLQLVGKETVLINRVSLKYAEGDLYVTYREGFKKIATTPAPGCKNALDYNRIASYVSMVEWWVGRPTNEECLRTWTD
jgi:hypothetical protein